MVLCFNTFIMLRMHSLSPKKLFTHLFVLLPNAAYELWRIHRKRNPNFMKSEPEFWDLCNHSQVLHLGASFALDWRKICHFAWLICFDSHSMVILHTPLLLFLSEFDLLHAFYRSPSDHFSCALWPLIFLCFITLNASLTLLMVIFPIVWRYNDFCAWNKRHIQRIYG